MQYSLKSLLLFWLVVTVAFAFSTWLELNLAITVCVIAIATCWLYTESLLQQPAFAVCIYRSISPAEANHHRDLLRARGIAATTYRCHANRSNRRRDFKQQRVTEVLVPPDCVERAREFL